MCVAHIWGGASDARLEGTAASFLLVGTLLSASAGWVYIDYPPLTDIFVRLSRTPAVFPPAAGASQCDDVRSLQRRDQSESFRGPPDARSHELTLGPYLQSEDHSLTTWLTSMYLNRTQESGASAGQRVCIWGMQGGDANFGGSPFLLAARQPRGCVGGWHLRSRQPRTEHSAQAYSGRHPRSHVRRAGECPQRVRIGRVTVNGVAENGHRRRGRMASGFTMPYELRV